LPDDDEMNSLPTRLLLNVGHALDHMFLLIFATAVTSIAAEFGLQSWEDLMPYSVAAFFFFGVGSLPAGKLGDQWGRRPMMIVFFVGIGLASMGVAAATGPLQIALALAVLGLFASIYHPVGIPMLVQGAVRPGRTIGINGLSGNLGVALAAVVTGFIVKYYGWRMAFIVPGAISIVCGLAFALLATKESAPPAKRKASVSAPAGISMAQLFLIMTLAATSASLVFNLSTNANYELLSNRFKDISTDPARIGLLLGMVYAAASFAQLIVGNLIDRYSLKTLYLSLIGMQVVFLAAATQLDGWPFYLLQFLFMAAIFGAVPFTDAMIVRYVDDSMRSRVTGMRLAVSLAASSFAVWLIGPVVRQAGFTTLLWLMAICAAITLAVVGRLPSEKRAV
jgi:MFS family permease